MSTIELWRDLCREKNAKVLSIKSNQINGEVELRRIWSIRRDAHVTEFADYFEKYSSVNNYPTECRYVVNPYDADEQDYYAGTWRQVGIEQADNGIIQTLRKSYLSTVKPSGAIDFSDCYVMSHTVSPGNDVTIPDDSAVSATPEKWLILQWRWCNVAKLADIVAELESFDEAVDVTIQGTNYGTGWTRLITSTAKDEDGAGVINMVIGDTKFILREKGYSLASGAWTGYELWNVPKAIAQDVLDAMAGIEGNLTSTADYDKNDGVVRIQTRFRDTMTGRQMTGIITDESCGVEVVVDYWWNVHFPYESYNEPSIEMHSLWEAGDPGAGRTFRLSSVNEGEDGSLSFVIELIRQIPRSYMSLDTQRSGGAWVDQDQLLAHVSDPADLTEETGKIKNRRWNINPDCSKDIVTDTIIPQYQTFQITYNDRYGQSSVKVVNNATNAQAQADPFITSMTSATENGINPRVNDADLIDYVAYKNSYEGAGAAASTGIVVDQTCSYIVTRYLYFGQPLASLSGIIENIRNDTDGDDGKGGFTYSVSNIYRESGTGTAADKYTFFVEVRERIYQHVGEYVVQKGMFSMISEEQHLGLRRDPDYDDFSVGDSNTDEDAIDEGKVTEEENRTYETSSGERVIIPQEDLVAQQVNSDEKCYVRVVRVDKRINPDCSYDITVRRERFWRRAYDWVANISQFNTTYKEVVVNDHELPDASLDEDNNPAKVIPAEQSVEGQLREHGLYDWSRVTVTAPANGHGIGYYAVGKWQRFRISKKAPEVMWVNVCGKDDDDASCWREKPTGRQLLEPTGSSYAFDMALHMIRIFNEFLDASQWMTGLTSYTFGFNDSDMPAYVKSLVTSTVEPTYTNASFRGGPSSTIRRIENGLWWAEKIVELMLWDAFWYGPGASGDEGGE